MLKSRTPKPSKNPRRATSKLKSPPKHQSNRKLVTSSLRPSASPAVLNHSLPRLPASRINPTQRLQPSALTALPRKLATPFIPSRLHFSTTSVVGNANGTPLIRSTLTDQRLYERESTKVLDTLVQRIEEPDIDYAFPIELDFSGDVLNFENPRGTWVLNKHNVTKQIWLSSPISGPSKYNYHPPNFNPATDLDKIYAEGEGSGGQWLSERNNTTKLSDVLKTEWTEVFKIPIQFQHAF